MRWIVIFIAILTLTSCTLHRNSPHLPFSRPAPQSESDVGYIVVSHDEAALAQMLDRTGASARRLHENSGWFEVFDLSKEELQRELPSSSLVFDKNHYVRRVLTPSPDIGERSMSIQSLSKMCHADQNPPKVIVTMSPIGLSVNEAVLLGSEIQFSAKADPSEKQNHPPFQYYWSVKNPGPSVYAGTPVEADQLKIEPDAVGLYEVVLFIKDHYGACSSKTYSFSVTDNPERKHVEQRQTLKPDEVSRYFHLTEIRAFPARTYSTGKSVLIAIVDTGVNYNHDELEPNIFINPEEIAGNGIDDDNNGYIDDEMGWDFANNDNRPFDDTGHGSHVAGLAAATSFGVAPEARILPVKVLNAAGGGDVASIATGIMYAVDRGARIINTSFGSSDDKFLALKAAFDYAEKHGALVVAAAGNGEHGSNQGLNIDIIPVMPATFENENIITIAASHAMKLAQYSNFGVQQVDLAAPGGERPKTPIKSIAVGNPYGLLYSERSGSSMAAALVSGAAALLLDLRPDLKPTEIKTILQETGSEAPNLKGLLKNARILNVESAVKSLGAFQQDAAPSSQSETKVAK